jgi:hypothetical protein
MSRYGTLAGIVFAACAPAHGPASPPAAQASPPIPLHAARRMFAEADALCAADNGALWGRSLCGPMMFADRATRFVVANRAASGSALVAREGVYVGYLPADQNIANTAFAWAGETWTQMIWPLPADRDERAILIMHERFHRVQSELGLAAAAEADNAHLDEVDGRYYLQLEWRALAAALRAPDARARDRAVADALAFRAARRRAFPGAAARENALEMNEGLAEYTGVVLGVRDDARVAAALRDLEAHVVDPSFVRSFAYATGPAYGLLLDRYKPGWRATIAKTRDLGAPLAEAVRGDPRTVEEAVAAYDGAALRAAELERAMQRAAAQLKYRRAFVDGAVLVLPFTHVKIDFDPRAVVPLGDLGSVYPNVRISDDWGVLEVTGGALVRADWSAVVVVAPSSAAERTVPGSWTLDLANEWKLVPGDRPGDFRVAKP